MQDSSQALHERRETLAYRQLPSSSDSSSQASNICMSSESDSHSRSESPFHAIDMNESKYSKVIFNEISESYPTDADIECRFYIGDSVKASEGDRIGLFKVGWVYAREGLVFKNVSKCETDNEFGEKKVRFDASQLPKSADEFFQFCYLTAGDDICGASTPFRFIRPHAEDLIQLTDNRNSDEEDFVVVRSQQALLQERLQQLVNENGVLEYSKRSLEQHMTSKSNEVSELRKMLVELEDRNKLSQLESTRIMAKLSSSEAQNCSHSERIEVLERELSEMRRSRDEYEARLAFTQSELNQLQDVVNGFEVKAFKCGEMLKTRDQEVFNLVKKTGEQQVLIDELSSTRAMVEAKLELSSTSIAKVMSERRDLESENRMLRSELEDTRAKCDSLQSKTDLMMAEILDFDKIKLKTKVQIQTANEEMVELKTRLDETEANKKATSGQWKQKEELFEKQIDELKSRLANAAEEYQKIYKYNTKLENRVDKIKAKVKKYFDTKSQTKAAVDVSLTERQELMAKAETEVKTVIVDMDTPLEERMSIRSLETPMEGACALPLPTTTITRVKAIDCSGGGERVDSIIQLTHLPCIICNEEITCMSKDSKPMIQHLEEKHSQRLCPVCSTPFDLSLPGHTNYFQMHVDNHFDTNMPRQETRPPHMYP